MTSTRYGITREEWDETLDDQPSYRVDQLWEGLWTERRPLEEISNLPLTLRERLAKDHPLALEVATERVADDGATVKWLYRLDDGYQIETVLMQYDDRSTVCVSSQAGCAMGCTFCATGQAGFDRHLRSDEILEQIVRAQHHDPSTRVSHVVFMGMGEPLANIDAVWSAVERIHGQLGISARRITISTVGVVPGIEFLAAAPLPIGLALSLHAATDEKRRPLVPLNRNYDIDELMEACERYLDQTHRRITFEWALIDGVNDSDDDAAELSVLARSIGAHVNVIPLNPTSGYPTRGTPEAGVRRFCTTLRSLGVNVTVRQTRGRDIDAACGQLRNDNPIAVKVARKPTNSTPD
ncbi:MAG: 23S rRNA (adenine(2503)-C(2))-methyltransferase RlmN [Acidobacteria bacterium]|nr:23S rRNA (adenine(2503)-C(2))-methyltransferase RlmN [Acidobacteriota bacterium]